MAHVRWRRLKMGIGLVAVLAIAACGSGGGGGGDQDSADSGNGGGSNSSSGETLKVGLLLPESKTARYEAADRPYFTKKVKKLCSNCKVLYQNADQKPDKQQSQAEAMITNEVDVLVLDPVDGKAAQVIVSKAKAADIPVVSYDRLTNGPVDYYISFDNVRVGKLQGKALLKKLKEGGDPKRGCVVMINGAPTDPNAAMFKKGAHSVLDGKVNICEEYDTPDWSPDKAQQEMDQAITAIQGQNKKIIGVYAANDGTAGGAIAAMKAAGIKPLPPVTGQDAELAGIQRIVAGSQYMTVYKAIKPEAHKAAKMAVSLAKGKEYSGKTTTVKNDSGNTVKAVLLKPVAVTQDNIKETVVADGFHTVDEICTKQFAKDCKKIGLTG